MRKGRHVVGPPFKFKTLHHSHTRFALCVRYQPGTGAIFVSGGMDGKVEIDEKATVKSLLLQLIIYEGSEGDIQGEIVDPSLKGNVAHSGSIFGLEFTRDGAKILTASGDKSAKLWDVAQKTLLAFVLCEEKTVQFTLLQNFQHGQHYRGPTTRLCCR